MASFFKTLKSAFSSNKTDILKQFLPDHPVHKLFYRLFQAAQIPGNTPGSVSLAENITSTGARWFWYGAPGNTREAWATTLTSGTSSYDLTGYRTVNFEHNGGTLNNTSTNTTAYVYPNGENENGPLPSWGYQANYTGIVPVLTGTYLLKLPTPTKTGQTFKGWCQQNVTTTQDCTTLQTTETPHTVTGTTPITLHALWETTKVTPTTPTIPTSVSVTPGDSQAVVSWDAPASDGGTPVTAYKIRHRATGTLPWTTVDVTSPVQTPTQTPAPIQAQAQAQALTVTVTGLTNGTTYEFQVAAINTIGTGEYSVVVKAIPAGKPPIEKPVGVTVSRVFGTDRYQTSLKLNQDRMILGAPVFIATGQSYPDALTTGPAVNSVNGSLFLTPHDTMPENMLDLITSKKPSRIYVIGGTNSISNTIIKQLSTISKVERIHGENRYATSTAIFNKFFTGTPLDGAFITTGTTYPDALSASAAGGALKQPVLLTNTTTNNTGLDLGVIQKLKTQGVTTIHIIGGTNTIPTKTQNQLASHFKVERLQGTDRYQTNQEINNHINQQLGTPPTNVWIASGQNYPDALTAAIPAGNPTSRLILSNGTCIPGPLIPQWTNGPNPTTTHITLTGGENTLNKNIHNLTPCQ